MNQQLLDQAIELTITGIGTVFIFLTLLIFFTYSMSRIMIYLEKFIVSTDEENGSLINQKEEIAKTIALHHHDKEVP